MCGDLYQNIFLARQESDIENIVYCRGHLMMMYLKKWKNNKLFKEWILIFTYVIRYNIT